MARIHVKSYKLVITILLILTVLTIVFKLGAWLGKNGELNKTQRVQGEVFELKYMPKPIFQDSAQDEVTCYSTDSHPYRLYGTKTYYDDVRQHVTFDDEWTGCQPKFFYLLSRHATRIPGDDDIIGIGTRLPVIRDALSKDSVRLCDADFENLKAWSPVFAGSDIRNARPLAVSGWNEMYDIAKRFQVRFPELLRDYFNSSQVHIQHTYLSRTRDTALAFISAVYNRTDIPMDFNPEGNDPLLRGYKMCRKYIDTVDEPGIAEHDKFLEGAEMNAVIVNVTRRLGLPPKTLSEYDIELIWDSCRFEHSILGKSPWCAAFVTSELQVMEYASDVNDYWKRGYGNSINLEKTCPLVKDIVANLRSAREGRVDRLTALRFGHSDTVQPLFARLGLFNDAKPLRSDNMDDMFHRKWHASVNGPFASNIAFVLYDCDGGRPYLNTLVNEVPVQLPRCPNIGLCPLNIALVNLEPFADSCDFEKICAVSAR